MKRILLAAAALAALTGGAQAATVTVNGTINNVCTITGTPTVTLNSAVIGGNAPGNDTQNTSVTAFCNTAAANQVTVASANGGLTHSTVTTAPANFDVRLNYTATVSHFSGSVTTDGDANFNAPDGDTGPLSAAAGAINDTVTVTIVTDAEQPLIAGAYADTITITGSVAP